MTLTCPSENCPFCSGSACNACIRAELVGDCPHDSVDRHAGIPALEESDLVHPSRKKTKEMLPIDIAVVAMVLTIADPKAACAYLRELADMIERSIDPERGDAKIKIAATVPK